MKEPSLGESSWGEGLSSSAFFTGGDRPLTETKQSDVPLNILLLNIVPSTPLEPPEDTELDNVSSKYHDLRIVFSKEKAQSLPPHRPYDSAIDLLPGLLFL